MVKVNNNEKDHYINTILSKYVKNTHSQTHTHLPKTCQMYIKHISVMTTG